MKKSALLLAITFFYFPISFAQNAPGVLTVEKIMRDPVWMGTQPSNIAWSADGKKLFFEWNPDKKKSDSLYYINWPNTKIIKASPQEKLEYYSNNDLVYNQNRSAATWQKNGDIYYSDLKGKTIQVTNTQERESSPSFSFGNKKIVYTRGQNVFAWDIASGSTEQLTGFTATPKSAEEKLNAQEDWLKKDQLEMMEILRERKEKKEEGEAYNKIHTQKVPKEISTKDKTLGRRIAVDNSGNFVVYSMYKPLRPKTTIVPNYVTESGFTENLPARSKVGTQPANEELYMYDRAGDTVYKIDFKKLEGLKDIPAYYNDYPKALAKLQKDSADRGVQVRNIVWHPTQSTAILDLYASDNKDRWIMLFNAYDRQLKLIDRQHNDAWIGGPGIGFSGRLAWLDNNTFWYQSEETGYSHLYTFNTSTGTRRQLTRGNYEVQDADLSLDKRSFYITTNEVHPGEKHFYKLDIASGKTTKLTSMKGANEATLSPNEQFIAIRNSYSTQPWELFVQPNKAGAKVQQITNLSKSAEFNSYKWRDPEVITFDARDGAKVYARVYKPQNMNGAKPAVVFVHGAGYLQNAHKWWSSYFREYMFNNLLADNGYVVMDIDYRASAGYGADWRTGIYRFMGGKDLTDHVDAVKYMTENLGVDPKRVGIYGGSYGGFITLMGLFTTPDVFKAGAALRPVTDWAQYNHGYTANILNEPATDSIAYRKSSPIYHAAGLKNHLLICHGMVDVNVHYQDVVKLTQRLIELGKDNWELASYPVEDHGFVEPSSWTDEYKRIFKLFENTLK